MKQALTGCLLQLLLLLGRFDGDNLLIHLQVLLIGQIRPKLV